MKDLNWKQGVERLYFAVWAAWFAVAVFGFIHDCGFTLWGIFLISVFGVAIPYGLLKAGQWVYTGLLTKQEQ